MRKLIAGIAALALASVVLFAGSTTPAEAGPQPPDTIFSGFAPVWQGSNSDWSSGVIVAVQHSHAPCPQWNNPALQCTYSYILGYDTGWSNADTVCTTDVYYHTADQQLHNGTEKCYFHIPDGTNKKAESWGGFYIDGQVGAIPFGACYKTWPDGNPYNGREWCNSIFG